MGDPRVPKVLAIALRSSPEQGKPGPMKTIYRVDARTDGGLDGDLPAERDRGITLLASGQWDQVIRRLGVDLPWHTRRANVLVEADSLAHLIGKTVAIGSVRVQVIGESRPCALMNRLHPGLREALETECRAGVYGRITQSGSFAVGDGVTLCA